MKSPLLVAVFLAAVVASTLGLPPEGAEFRHRLHIVGGETAYIKDVPYQVSIEVQRAHSCGGSVLAASWVLTAAHCVTGLSPLLLQVRAGTDVLQQGGSVHAVKAAVLHPKYMSRSVDWDVALLQLAAPLRLSATVKAVKLPASGREPSNNTPVLVSGWGLTTPQKGGDRLRSLGGRGGRGGRGGVAGLPKAPNLPTHLRKVTVRVVARTACKSAYSVLTERMICAAAAGKDACTYDSGGPLVDPQGVQVGVVSYGNGCADPLYPGVYTHLGHPDIRSFLKKHAGV